MSYILDALRRADSERERGTVPSIHAQPVPVGSADPQPHRPGKAWPWVVVGLSAGLAVPLAWQMLGRGGEPDPIDSLPVAAAPVPTRAAPAPPAPTTAAPAAPAAAPAAAAMAPAALPDRRSDSTAPAREPSPAARKTPPATQAAAAPATARQTARSELSKPPAPPASEARIHARNELPDEIQRQLPTLAIGGSIYSQNPADRLLIINGRLFHEGDQLAPDLSLREIRLKGAVLKFKEYLYTVAY